MHTSHLDEKGSGGMEYTDMYVCREREREKWVQGERGIQERYIKEFLS